MAYCEVEAEILEDAPLEGVVLESEGALALSLLEQYLLDQDIEELELQVAQRHVPEHLASSRGYDYQIDHFLNILLLII